MKAAKKESESTLGPIGRFLVGSLMSGGITFFSIFIYGQSAAEAATSAGIAALVIGVIVGLLSAFGRRLFQFFVAWFTHMPW